MAFKVLVSDKLAQEGIDTFKQRGPDLTVDVNVGLSPDGLKAIIGDYDGLAIRSATKVTADVLAAAPKLKVVGRAGIGVDNVDIDAATERGVLVMNTPEGNVVTTAEHAISLLCALVRNIPQATASMKSGKWEKSKFQGSELSQKNLGLVGLGNIGKIVADRALGLHMRVLAYDPFVTKERARELGVELVSLDELLKNADFVTLHVPLLEATKNLINKDSILKMKDGAFLVNAARGGLVDEAAVAEALRSKKLAGAAFDVFEKEPPGPDHPFLQLDNMILTPHLGASTSEAQINVAVAVAEQISDYLTTGAIRNAINAPAVSADLMETVGPYGHLGEKIGSMAGQLHRGDVASVRINYAGEVSELPLESVTASVLTGLLATALGRDVNPVSASHVAKERGIEVIEERKTKTEHFANAVTIRVIGAQGTTEVIGALYGKDARIVGVDGFIVEVPARGHIIMTHHHDRPGIIGRIGSILGQNRVNISGLSLSKAIESSDLAKAVLSIDSRVDEVVLKQIADIEGIEEARFVHLGET